MQYIVKGNEISSFANNVDNIINNYMIPKINVMKEYASRTDWNGDVRNKFVSKYEDIVFELEKIPYCLSLYTDFLSKTTSNYEDALLELEKKFKKLEEELEKGRKYGLPNYIQDR